MSGEWIDPGRDHWGFEYEIQSPDDKEIAKDNTERLAEMTKMTDDNDNLVDVPEEDDYWVETEDGFFKGEIKLDDDVVDTLVDDWARSNLDPASLSQYIEVKAAEGQAKALLSGVLNSVLLEALTEAIDKAESNSNDAA